MHYYWVLPSLYCQTCFCFHESKLFGQIINSYLWEIPPFSFLPSVFFLPLFWCSNLPVTKTLFLLFFTFSLSIHLHMFLPFLAFQSLPFLSSLLHFFPPSHFASGSSSVWLIERHAVLFIIQSSASANGFANATMRVTWNISPAIGLHGWEITLNLNELSSMF